ncbi:MAG: polysaccharide deacetylase family protein [Nitrososphaeria archaeon]
MLYFVTTVDVDPPIPPFCGRIFIENGVEIFLKLFEKYSIKATFFVPALIADKFPKTIKKIAEKGHEVACHGLKHDRNEAKLSVRKQIQIIKKASEIIKSVVGLSPLGYRAPLFNIDRRNCWVALQKNGYVYDSSIVCSPFYGEYKSSFSAKPFPLDKDHSLLEVPISVNPILPYPLGGAYFRIFGTKWCKLGIKINLLCRNPVVFYIHPKDVIPRSWGFSWLWYKNTDKCIKMFEEVIKYAKQCGANFVGAYDIAKLFRGL